MAGASAAIAVAYGWQLLRTIDRDAGGAMGARLGRLHEPGFAELGAVGVVLVVAFPLVAFPPAPTGDGAVVNLYTHLLGFCLAFVAGYVHPSVERRVTAVVE